MEITRLPGRTGTRTLVSMLPGAYSRPADFESQGFVRQLRQAGWGHDVALVDAHLGYVTDRSVLLRLREDLLLPARRQGYESIWLVGISLGGFVALIQALEEEPLVDGVVTLAPYLGSRLVYRRWLALPDEQRAQALKDWSEAPADTHSARQEHQAEEAMVHRLWSRHARRDVKPPVWIGWGLRDRFAQANAALSAAWPERFRLSAEGDHDWPAWKALWAQWLEREAPQVWNR